MVGVFPSDEDVGRFDITMYESPSVRRVDRRCNVRYEMRGVRWLQATTLLNQSSQRLAVLDVSHRHK